MTPLAARAALAAHLTDTLDMPPHRATLTATELLDRLAVEGWEITTTTVRVRHAGIDKHHEHNIARPVAPRARETRRARRLVARLLSRGVLHVRHLADEVRQPAR